MPNEDKMALLRRQLALADTAISEHHKQQNVLSASLLAEHLELQRQTRKALRELGDPDAPSWWGKYKERQLGQTWVNKSLEEPKDQAVGPQSPYLVLEPGPHSRVCVSTDANGAPCAYLRHEDVSALITWLTQAWAAHNARQ